MPPPGQRLRHDAQAVGSGATGDAADGKGVVISQGGAGPVPWRGENDGEGLPRRSGCIYHKKKVRIQNSKG